MELTNLDELREEPSLAIPYASLGDEHFATIAHFLKVNTFCKFLDLRGNSIGSHGGHLLADAMRTNKVLTHLCLKWNSIGKDATVLEALCKALYPNLTLRQLDLRNNRICSVGARHVAELLKHNTSLTHIDLSWNEFEAEGGRELLEALRNNHTMVELQLSGSKVGDQILNEVSFLLRRNRAAQAYKASNGETAVERPLLPDPSPPERLDNPVTPRSPKRKIDQSVLTQLIMKERETIDPNDKHFFRDVVHLLEKLQFDAKTNQRARRDTEERERQTTSGFVSNEQEFSQKIRKHEDDLQSLVKAKAQICQELSRSTAEEKRAEEEKRMVLHDTMLLQEQSVLRESEAKRALQEIITDKNNLELHVDEARREYEALLKENARLKASVRAFQRDVSEILVT